MGRGIGACKNIIKTFLGKKLYNCLAGTYFLKRNPDFKRYSSKNAELKNKYAGKRCFIIGNGPSLKTVDFSQLADEYTFTVNQLPRNDKFGKMKTNFHVWADERFFNLDLSKSEDLELFNVMKAVSTEDNNPVVFYKWTAREMIERNHLEKTLNIRYFGDIGMDIPKALTFGGALNICEPLPIFSTVIHYAICLAVYMGFQEIFLLGCDCTGFISTAQAKLKNANQSEYAYSITDNEKKRMERISDKTSIRNELLWYAELFDTYDFMKRYCEKQGVKLLNATKNTLLESIPRVDLATLLHVRDEK